jgi:hypothetical protein
MVVIVPWKVVQTAVVDMVSVESIVTEPGSVAVMMAGTDGIAVSLWNRAVVMEGTMIKVGGLMFHLTATAHCHICFLCP